MKSISIDGRYFADFLIELVWRNIYMKNTGNMYREVNLEDKAKPNIIPDIYKDVLDLCLRYL